MFTDVQGLRVSTRSAAALDHINCFIEQALSYGSRAEAAITEAITADPSCAIAYAYAANYHLSQESAAGQQRAMPFLAAAQRFKPKATLREQLYIEAITAWAQVNIERAIAHHERIVEQYPQDLMAVQQGQYHYFYQGDSARLLGIAKKASAAGVEHHFLYGMVAFGLEQCQRLEEAEALGRWAIALDRNDPWAQHAVAHVLETQGRVAEGIAWMEQFADTWESCNSMLYTHNWWHVALYYLKQGNSAKVLQLYDRHVWGRAHKASPKDQVGAISLLLRLELQGVNVGNRWDDLAFYCRDRLHEHSLPFQDLHYLYALARNSETDAVEQMLTSIKSHILSLSVPTRSVWRGVLLPAAQGLIAHAQGQHQRAAAYLKPVIPYLWQLGGSHAQQELFKQVYCHVLSQPQRPEPAHLWDYFPLRVKVG